VKILVLTTAYPTEDNPGMMMYVHTRNLYYAKEGIDVTVLSFSSHDNYVFQGISVITLDTFEKHPQRYEILVAHAPNIRFHYRFLQKYENQFKKIVLFFHGHEVLKVNRVYSRPYSYMKKTSLRKRIIQDVYDDYKLFLWRNYLPKILHKTFLIFVSNWMYEEFIKWVKLPRELINDKYSITYNGVGEIFEKKNYDNSIEKEFDFITIRPNLDGSKYAIDIVRDLAIANPDKKFLVIGKGEFFDHYSTPENMTRIERILNHDEIIDYLNKSKCALMPTRTDAQGLMACEMATFGLPLITSDIPVCHEIFIDFPSVVYIDNETQDGMDLSELINNLITNKEVNKIKTYYSEQTMRKEFNLLINISTV
jgi:glycosyltransferase involved in cell wall biosynthesis